MAFAVEHASRGDEEKVVSSCAACRGGPTIDLHRDQQRATDRGGLSQVHWNDGDAAGPFGVEVHAEAARVPYRETSFARRQRSGRHKKQSGGRGHSATADRDPAPPTASSPTVKIRPTTSRAADPSSFIPAVEKGVRER